MAKWCAMLLVGLVLASTLCAGNAGLVPAEPGRKLLLGDVAALLKGLTRAEVLDIIWDLTAVSAKVKAGTATLVVGGEETVGVPLEAGKKNELVAVDVTLADGVVCVRLGILGVDEVLVLDLVKLQAILVGGKLKVVVVLVLDEEKKVLHVRNLVGESVTDIRAIDILGKI